MYKLFLIKQVDEMLFSSSFLQSNFWGAFKATHGWEHLSFFITYKDEKDDEVSFCLSILLRRLKFFGYIAYVPMLPSVPSIENSFLKSMGKMHSLFLQELSGALFNELHKPIFFIRFDSSWQVEVENGGGQGSHESVVKRPDFVFENVNNLHIKKAKTDIQPPDTVILDLTLSEEALLAQFKSKWRYNIRLSEKKGCIVECEKMDDDESIEKAIDMFYSLYETTSERDGIAIHSKEYYKSLFFKAKEYKDVSLRLYVAKYNNLNLASIITIFYKSEATYLYGASSNNYRNMMPTYLLQWKAIKDAKQYGCSVYDFYGMPPLDDPRHPMAGLYRFKTGFGGKIIHRIGSIDVYKNTFHYRVYSILEVLRAFYFKKIKKLFVKKK